MKNKPRKLLSTLLIAMMVIGLFAAAPLTASAADSWVLTPGGASTATGIFTVTKFDVLWSDGTAISSTHKIDQWDALKVEMEFKLSDTGFPENSVTVIELPDDLEFGEPMGSGSLSFDLNVEGSSPAKVFAKAVVNLTAKTITLTYTDYPSKNANVRGKLNFWVSADLAATVATTTISFENKSFIGSGGITIGYERIGENPAEVVAKWGSVLLDTSSDPLGSKYGQYYINYGMRLNAAETLNISSITDNLGTFPLAYKDAVIDWSTFRFQFADYAYNAATSSWGYTTISGKASSSWDNLDGRHADFGISSMTKDADDRGFEIEFSPVATTSVIIYYRVYLGIVPPAEGTDKFENTVILNGSSTDKRTINATYLSGGSGSGIGNNYIISIRKVRSGSTDILPGASFAIYAANAAGDAPEGPALATSDDSDGSKSGVHEFTGLLLRKYFIVETAAPTGYVLNSNPFLVDLTLHCAPTKLDYEVDFPNAKEPTTSSSGDDDPVPPPQIPKEPEIPEPPVPPVPPAPPVPSLPENTLIPDGDGWIELYEDGTPFGKWEWDEDEEVWVLGEWESDEDTTPDTLPAAGDGGIPMHLFSLIGVSLVGIGVALRFGRKKRGKHE